MEISTAWMPRTGDQATPAIGVVPAVIRLRCWGTSMREAVFIGPSLDQPRSIQYPLNASQVVRLISSIHLVAET